MTKSASVAAALCRKLAQVYLRMPLHLLLKTFASTSRLNCCGYFRLLSLSFSFSSLLLRKVCKQECLQSWWRESRTSATRESRSSNFLLWEKNKSHEYTFTGQNPFPVFAPSTYWTGLGGKQYLLQQLLRAVSHAGSRFFPKASLHYSNVQHTSCLGAVTFYTCLGGKSFRSTQVIFMYKVIILYAI